MQGAECPLEFFKQNPPCNFHAGVILAPRAPDASHMVSHCHETLGAERIRALHDASKCHETPSAERMCARHMFAQCHETLGAEHIRASHVVSQCLETLGAERMRASHEVSQCHEALGVQSDCTPKKSPIDVLFGRQRQTVPLAP